MLSRCIGVSTKYWKYLVRLTTLCEWCLTIDLEELLFLGAATILLFETVKAEQTGDGRRDDVKGFHCCPWLICRPDMSSCSGHVKLAEVQHAPPSQVRKARPAALSSTISTGDVRLCERVQHQTVPAAQALVPYAEESQPVTQDIRLC